ncbi:MAG: MarR family transcriptional regulator [Rhizobiales bacterium]|nr:MarR family transcriptional regulator [Hyphomicrobiales bacterium]OJY46996.1 MAG: hypothetical protein BGP08_02995 [Rhizobiales bacterium 64-17]
MAGKQKNQTADFRIESYPLFAMAHIVAEAQNRIVNTVRGYRMSPSVWRVIAMLSETEGITINALAGRIVVERSALSRIIAKLEADGLVERRSDPRDLRSSLLHLTTEGWKLYRESVPVARELLDRMMSVLTEAERATLMELLDRIRRNGLPGPDWLDAVD